jgi:nicotinamidase/pyrazinamidase
VKTVLFDVDTQIDFLFPAGALYVPGAERIVNPIRELARFAASNRLQIISTADAHSENDPEFNVWRPHCVAGTTGQQKHAHTLVNRLLVLSSAPGALDAVREQIKDAPQIVVEKQTLDCFSNPNLRPLLDLLGANRYLVCGVATEHCVRYAAFGLLETGARVELVTDAIAALSSSEEREMLDRFQAQGGHLTTTAKVLAESATTG